MSQTTTTTETTVRGWPSVKGSPRWGGSQAAVAPTLFTLRWEILSAFINTGSPRTGCGAAITSTDAPAGEAVRIRRADAGWSGDPSDGVRLLAATSGCSTAAEAAARQIRLFAGPEQARAYLAANPALDGEVFDQATSVEIGRTVFGSLLAEAQGCQA